MAEASSQKPDPKTGLYSAEPFFAFVNLEGDPHAFMCESCANILTPNMDDSALQKYAVNQLRKSDSDGKWLVSGKEEHNVPQKVVIMTHIPTSDDADPVVTQMLQEWNDEHKAAKSNGSHMNLYNMNGKIANATKNDQFVVVMHQKSAGERQVIGAAQLRLDEQISGKWISGNMNFPGLVRNKTNEKINIDDRYPAYESSVYISSINIDAGWRGKGLGALLLDFILDHLPLRATRAHLVTWGGNHEMQGVALSRGFRFLSDNKAINYVTQKDQNVEMYKPIKPGRNSHHMQ